MTHPTDDDLILHCYGEHPAGEAARIDAHLAVCASCGESWRELRETLQMVDAAAVPEPSPAFERLMWARIAPAIRREEERVPAAVTASTATPSRRRSAWLTGRWLIPATGLFAATLVASMLRPGTVKKVAPPDAPAPPPVTKVAATDADKDPAGQSRRVLFSALDSHFAQTEVLLVELLNRPENDLALDFERGAAGDLLADGRLYRLTAVQTGEQRYVDVLDDLESVLVEVARSPEKVKRQDMKVLRSRIDDDGLLFKVRAVTHEIRERQQEMFTVTANEGSL
jgi:hypothetical protein